VAAYSFLVAEPTVQDLGGDIVRDAQRVTARASASGVVFALEFAPYPTDEQGSVIWTSQLIADQLAYWAGQWDANSAIPGVLGIGLSQAVNPLGQLRDVAIVVVQSSSGQSTTNLTVDERDFQPGHIEALVQTARAQLDAVEAGG
jgi:hypothetical protein